MLTFEISGENRGLFSKGAYVHGVLQYASKITTAWESLFAGLDY